MRIAVIGAGPTGLAAAYALSGRGANVVVFESTSVSGGMARTVTVGEERIEAFYHHIFTSDEALGVYGAVDCGAYVGNFLLAAHSLGVATIAQAALAAYPSVLREVLGIAQDRSIVCGISFGLADPAHPANGFRTQRAAPGDSVTWRD